MTNCVNCGAPLTGNKCEYCGTEYAEPVEKIMAEMHIKQLERECENIRFQMKMQKMNQELLNSLFSYGNNA